MCQRGTLHACDTQPATEGTVGASCTPGEHQVDIICCSCPALPVLTAAKNQNGPEVGRMAARFTEDIQQSDISGLNTTAVTACCPVGAVPCADHAGSCVMWLSDAQMHCVKDGDRCSAPLSS